MIELNKLLKEALSENHYAISDANQTKLVTFLELLQQWNTIFNLTAIRSPKEAVYLHILDSLSILPYLHGSRLLDVGSGAGLPGIPLAIIEPDKQFFLLDSNSKKTRFLNQVVYELGLKNITVIHERAENFHPSECFDSIITRAFASLNDMLVATQHLLAPHGQFIAMKGVYPEAELAAVSKPFKLQAVHPLTIQGLDAKRHVVCIEILKE